MVEVSSLLEPELSELSDSEVEEDEEDDEETSVSYPWARDPWPRLAASKKTRVLD
jgi:hypothetical protein